MNITQPVMPFFAPSMEWMEAERPVLLTFDDGPCGSTTSMLLDVLSKYRIKACFFVVGERLEQSENREVFRRMINEGHLVGNHSYTHPNLAVQARDRVVREIQQTQNIIESFGVRERLFRPPYGRLNALVFDVVKEQGLWGMGWNADTEDWNEIYKPDRWIVNGFRKVRRNKESIVLLHDTHSTTVTGSERFIDLLLRSGCTFPPLFTQDEVVGSEARHWQTSAQTDWIVLKDLQLFRPTPHLI